MSWARRLKQRMKGAMHRRLPLMISCAEFEEFILDYLEGRLPAKQTRVFELHLKLCRECRRYLEAYRDTVALGKAAFASGGGAAPGKVPEDLIQAVLAARRA